MTVYPPFGIFVGEKLLDPLLLLLFAYMEEEFYDKVTVIGQLPLKLADTVQMLLVGFRIVRSIQKTLRYLIHPASVKKRKLTGLRDADKIPIQKRFSLLLRRFL